MYSLDLRLELISIFERCLAKESIPIWHKLYILSSSAPYKLPWKKTLSSRGIWKIRWKEKLAVFFLVRDILALENLSLSLRVIHHSNEIALLKSVNKIKYESVNVQEFHSFYYFSLKLGDSAINGILWFSVYCWKWFSRRWWKWNSIMCLSKEVLSSLSRHSTITWI